MNDNPFQSEYHGVTTVHPLGLAAVVVLGLATILLPRRYATIPMLIMASFVVPSQRIVIMTLDFNFLRLMVLFGWARVLLRAEHAGFRWHPVDGLLIAWGVTKTVAYTTLHGSSGFVFMLGSSYDAVGMYFLFRWLIRDWSDLVGLLRGVALIAVPVAASFTFELATGRNLFAIFGGVSPFTAVRNGELRAQGAYAHPILAGTFWATLLPLILALWWRGLSGRVLASVGAVSALFIVVACNSSTPLAAAAAGIFALTLVSARRWMRAVRWGLVFTLFGLHLVMNKPVWHLISRIDLVGGSTGWHRYYLIDQAINRVNEWALVGTRSTAHWGHQLFDVTNQYVLEGVRGGILTLALFIAVISFAYRAVGRTLRRMEGGDRAQMMMAWSLGAALFVHTMAFIAVSYFGQIIVVWYLTLAAIVSLRQGVEVAPALLRARRIRRVRAAPAPRPTGHHPVPGFAS